VKNSRVTIKNLLVLSTLALFFIVVGIFVASNLNLPGETEAEIGEGQPPFGDSFLYGQHSPFATIAETVKPAVVNISAESVRESPYQQFFPYDDEFFRRFFGIPPEQFRGPQKSRSLGSGFVVTEDGYIVTNNHVVRDADKITVKLSDKSQFRAKLVGTDQETDLAVLKVDADHRLLTVLMGDSDSIRVGDWAMAIGNPFPELGLDRTVTVGVVSALGRRGFSFGGESPSYQDYIQTDASINPGNSGGPLVDIHGRVIGINSAIVSPSGGNVGIGFAIPIDLAKPVIRQLISSGTVERGFLGIMPQEIDKDMAEAMNLTTTEGVLVSEVTEGSPADKAGFKVGDVITEFAGTTITDLTQFRLLVASKKPGEQVELEILRDGKRKALKVKLEDRREFLGLASGEKEQPGKAEHWLGVEVVTMTRELAQQYNIKYVQGVLITGIYPGSAADDSELQRLDIILEIDGRRIETEKDYNEVAKSLKGRKKAVSFFVDRGGINQFVAVRPE
jgi:serine protease Do